MRIDSVITQSFKELSSMKRVNSAADDAAALSISEKLKSVSKGYDAANNNAESMDDLSKTAESGLSSVNDNLQRIRELSISANNASLSDKDKSLIQNEISHLKSSISDTIENTRYNNTKLLDGSFNGKSMSLGAKGGGGSVTIEDSSLKALGIENFDVTKNFNISDIDNAISKVSDSKSNLGAVSNRIARSVSVNRQSQANTMDAVSRMTDTNIAKTINELKTQQSLSQFKNFSISQNIAHKTSKLSLFG